MLIPKRVRNGLQKVQKEVEIALPNGCGQMFPDLRI
jgi:hypothetical protein